MAEAVFVIDPGGWQRAFKTPNTGVVGGHIARCVTKQIVLSKASAPSPGSRPRNRTKINYSKGALKASIVGRSGRWAGNEVEGTVTALMPYSLFVHEGTRPHVIVPKRATVLKFFWVKRGRTVYVQKVIHPGTRPIPFLAENLRAAIR